MRPEGLQAVGSRLRRRARRMTAKMRAARAPGSHVERRPFAVHGEHLDGLTIDTQLLGNDLHHASLLAGAGIGSAEAQPDMAVGEYVHGSITAISRDVVVGTAAVIAGRHADAAARFAVRLLFVPADRDTHGVQAFNQPRRTDPPALEQDFAGLIRVLEAEIKRIGVEFFRKLVHQAFESEPGLARAIASERAAGVECCINQPAPRRDLHPGDKCCRAPSTRSSSPTCRNGRTHRSQP